MGSHRGVLAYLAVAAPAKIIREQSESDDDTAVPAAAVGDEASAPTVVTMAGLRFSPGDLVVDRGATVRFENDDVAPHTVTESAGGVDSGTLAPTPGAENGRFAGSNASVTLPSPGTFAFHCEVHPQTMKGTLTVTGDEKDTPAAASSAPREVTVEMEDVAFKPPEVSVAPGVLVRKRGAPAT